MRIIVIVVFLIQLINPVLAQEVRVDFKIKDFPDSTVYVGYHFGNQKYILDTLNVKNDAFSLVKQKSEVKPGLYFLYTPEYFFEFVLEDRSFELSATYKKGYDSFFTSGSPENKLFKSFQLELGGLQKEKISLQQALKEGSGDSLEMINNLKEIDTQIDAFRNDIIKNYPESFMATFLKLMEDVTTPAYDGVIDVNERRNLQYLHYKNHYFDQVDLDDPRLLRSPLLYSKVMTYFEKLVINRPDSVISELDRFFAKVESSPELFRYWLVTLFNHYTASKVMGMDEVMVYLIENYYLSDQVTWVDDQYEKKLREEVAYRKPNLIGKMAPPLNVVDTLMQPIDLAQIESPYTLLFIYDPDCGHCKSTIKELEQQDSELSKLGVRVMAVCTITDVEKWKSFVENSNPFWLHTIDPTGQSYFRVTYNVRSTPKMYLLDDEKHIVAKDLDVAQLVDFIKRDE